MHISFLCAQVLNIYDCTSFGRNYLSPRLYCSQLFLWCLIHENFSTFDGSKEVSQIALVFDSSSVGSIVKLSGERCTTDFTSKSFTIKWCWESGIFFWAEWLNSVDVITTMSLFTSPMLLVLISYCIFINTSLRGLGKVLLWGLCIRSKVDTFGCSKKDSNGKNGGKFHNIII